MSDRSVFWPAIGRDIDPVPPPVEPEPDALEPVADDPMPPGPD